MQSLRAGAVEAAVVNIYLFKDQEGNNICFTELFVPVSGSEHLPVRKQMADYCSSSSSEGELECKASWPRKVIFATASFSNPSDLNKFFKLESQVNRLFSLWQYVIVC